MTASTAEVTLGAHYNPAVTLAIPIRGRSRKGRMLYMSQCCGSVFGLVGKVARSDVALGAPERRCQRGLGIRR